MTFLPSRRLRSSGNNALVALVICVVLASCGTQRRSRKTPSVVEAPPKKEIEIPNKNEPAPAQPDVIKLTYLLPFNTDEIPFDTAGNVTKKLSEQTKIALDYYRGAMLALDTVQKGGVRLKAFVYDTQADTARVRALFNKPEVMQSQLVVGPVYNAQLQTAAPLARKNKVYLLSPFSTVNDFVERNPYYILANSSLPTHCELLYDYAVEQHHPSRILMLYNNNQTDRQYAQYFINREEQARNGIQLVSLTDSSEVPYDRVEEMLSDSGTNVIIVPSVTESFVSSIVRKLGPLTDKYKINLYGMPQWRDFRTVSPSTFDKLNTRITAAMWFDKSDPEIVRFTDRYTKRFGAAPSEYALEGYNQTLFFASFIAAKGNNFDKLLPEYGMTTAGETYHFQTMRRQPLHHTESTNMPPFDFIENRSVHILEYKAGRLVKLK